MSHGRGFGKRLGCLCVAGCDLAATRSANGPGKAPGTCLASPTSLAWTVAGSEVALKGTLALSRLVEPVGLRIARDML